MSEFKHPIRGRYAGKEMKELFPEDPEYFLEASEEMKIILDRVTTFHGWRDDWYVLAKNQKILGVPIPDEHLAAIEKAKPNLDVKRSDEIERQIKHEPNNHVRHYSEEVEKIIPGAGKWVHNGATSEFVLGNQDRRTQKQALEHLIQKTSRLDLDDASGTPDNLHFIIEEWNHRLVDFPARGAKGTTGTQDSYLTMFDGDAEKVFKLDELVARDLGFSKTFTLTGQTNPRVTDVQLLFDLKLLADFCPGNEINPEAEKTLNQAAYASVFMAGAQMLERTLDDSSERRVLLTEPFLAADVLLQDLNSYVDEHHPPLFNREFDHRPSQKLEIYGRAMNIIKEKTVNLIKFLDHYADKYKNLPCMGYTHLQPAQPTTVGKRIALWNYNLILAFKDLEHIAETNFEGIDQKIVENRYGSVLAQIAASAAKMAHDVRILQKDFELAEPYSEKQTGSSAMPHKHNPMLSERMNSFARQIIYHLAKGSLDYAFLTADALLKTANTIFTDQPPADKTSFEVYEQVTNKNLMEQLPFLTAEKVLTDCVKKGYNRTEAYEAIRGCANEALENVRSGSPNNMVELMAQHENLPLARENPDYLKNPQNFIGLAPQQVDRFHKLEVQPILTKYQHLLKDQEQTQI